MTHFKNTLKKLLTYVLIFNIVLTQWLQAVGPLRIEIARDEFEDQPTGRISLRVNETRLDYQTHTGIFQGDFLHEGAQYNVCVKAVDTRKSPQETPYQVTLKKEGGGFDLRLRFSRDGLVDVDQARTQDFFSVSTFGSLHLADKTHHIAAALFTAKSIYNFGRCHISQYLGLKRFEESIGEDRVLFRNASDAHLFCQGRLDLFDGDFENQRALTVTGDLDVHLNGQSFVHKHTAHHLSRMDLSGRTRFFGGDQVLFQAPVEGENASLSVQATRFAADIKSPRTQEAHKRPRGLVVKDMDVHARQTYVSSQTYATFQKATFAYHGQTTQDFAQSQATFDGNVLCRDNLLIAMGHTDVGRTGLIRANNLTASGDTFENHGNITSENGAYFLKNHFANDGSIGAHQHLLIQSQNTLLNEARGHLYATQVTLAAARFKNAGLIMGGQERPLQDLSIDAHGSFENTGHMEAKRVHGTFKKHPGTHAAPSFYNKGHVVAQDQMILSGDCRGINQGLVKSRSLTLEGTMGFVNDGATLGSPHGVTGTLEAGTLHLNLRGGHLINNGVLETHDVDGFATKFSNFSTMPVRTRWQLWVSSFKNAGVLHGQGVIRTANFTNTGQVTGDLTLEVGAKGENLGVLDVLCLVGEGHFLNTHMLLLKELDISTFVNGGLLQCEALHLGARQRHFENNTHGTLRVARLTTQNASVQERVFVNKGHAAIEHTDMKAKVILSQNSTWIGRSLAWVGSHFHLENHANLKGLRSLTMTGKTLNESHLVLKDAAASFSSLENRKKITVEGGTFQVVSGHNTGRLKLKRTQADFGQGPDAIFTNDGEMWVGQDTKANLVHVDNEGVVRYGAPNTLTHLFEAHSKGRKVGRLVSDALLTVSHAPHTQNISVLWQHMRSGLLQAPLLVESDHMTMREDLIYAHALTLRAQHFENFADVLAKHLSIVSARTQNHGRLGARENLTLQNVASLGRVHAGQTLEIDGSIGDLALQNQHIIEGAKAVVMKLGGALINYQNLEIAHLFSVTAQRFSNFARVKAGRILADLLQDLENGRASAWGALESTKEEITVLCRNAFNAWGEILSVKKLMVKARENITNGDQLSTNVRWGVPFYKSNGALMVSLEDMELSAGMDFLNSSGTVISMGQLVLSTAGEAMNEAGFMYVGKNAYLNGKRFENVRKPSLKRGSGSANNGKGSSFRLYRMDENTGAVISNPVVDGGKHNYPEQHFITSPGAKFYVGQDLFLAPGTQLLNKASTLHVAGIPHAGAQSITLVNESLVATALFDHGKGPWPEHKHGVQTLHAQFLTCKPITFNLDHLRISGIFSAPLVEGLVHNLMEIHGQTHASPPSSSASSAVAHLLPFIRAYEPQGLITERSVDANALSALSPSNGGALVTVGRSASPSMSATTARLALQSLVGVGPQTLENTQALAALGASASYPLAPLGRGALPHDLRPVPLPASHPGYLYGLSFLKEAVDPRVNAAILCASGVGTQEMTQLFENHTVVSAVQPFLETLWFIEVLRSFNTGYLIGGMETRDEINLLKDVGLRFAMALGRQGILCLQDAEMDMCPFPMILYKPLRTGSYYALSPHLYIPQNFWNDPLAVARRAGQGGLYVDQGIRLKSGQTEISGTVASTGEVNLESEENTRIAALARRDHFHKGHNETRALGTGTVMSFEDKVRVASRKKVLLEGASIGAEEALTVTGHTGVDLGALNTHASAQDDADGTKVIVETVRQSVTRLVSRRQKATVSSAQGAVTGIAPAFSSPVEVSVMSRDGTSFEASRETQSLTLHHASGWGAFKDDHQSVTHMSTPTGAVFNTPKTTFTTSAPGSSVALEAPDLSQSTQILFETPATHILSAQRVTQSQHMTSQCNPIINTMTGGGRSHVDYVAPRFGALPTFKAPEGTDTPPQIFLSATRADLEKDAILARIASLPNTLVQTLQQESLTWEKTTRRLGVGVMVAAGICLTMLTGGAGASPLVAALQAVDVSMTLQFLDAFVAHNGKISSALKETFSAQSLRAAASSALTAAIGSSINSLSGATSVKGSLEFKKHLYASVRQSVSKIASQVIFEGKGAKQILTDGLLSVASNTFAGFAASHIGEGMHHADGRAPSLDPVTHKLLHAAVGGAAAAIARKDMTSGAVGAVVGECVGEMCKEELIKGHEIGTKSYEDALEMGVGISGMVAAMAAACLDLDAETAANAATNAVQNNCMVTHASQSTSQEEEEEARKNARGRTPDRLSKERDARSPAPMKGRKLRQTIDGTGEVLDEAVKFAGKGVAALEAASRKSSRLMEARAKASAAGAKAVQVYQDFEKNNPLAAKCINFMVAKSQDVARLALESPEKARTWVRRASRDMGFSQGVAQDIGDAVYLMINVAPFAGGPAKSFVQSAKRLATSGHVMGERALTKELATLKAKTPAPTATKAKTATNTDGATSSGVTAYGPVVGTVSRVTPRAPGAGAVKGAALSQETKKAAATQGRSGKQKRLKELARDDKLGSADRGWIQQEINSVERSSLRKGRDGTLRPQKNIRVHPTKEMAHRRGKAAKDGYGYEHSDLQDIDLHKLQHKHEGYK